MRHFVSGILAAAIALSIVPALRAQEQGLRDRDQTLDASKTIAADLQKARAHYGPFYLLSSIELSDIGYNQTLFAPTTESGTRVAFGIAAPQRLYFVKSRKQVYSISATPQYAYATRNEGQFGYLVRGDAQYLLNHLYLDVFATQSDALRASNTEINRLTTVRQRGAGVTGEVRYSTRTSLAFNASTNTYRHPESRIQPVDIPGVEPGLRIDILDRTEQNYRLALYHKTFPLTSLIVAGERSNYSFPRASYKSSTRTYAGVGATRESGRSLTRLEVGTAKLDFIDPSRHDFRGAVGNFSTSYRATGRTSLFGNAGRDVDFSVSPVNDYYVTDRAAAGVTYVATRRLTLNLTSSAFINRYPLAERDPLGVFHRRQDTTTFNSVGWLYTLRHVRGGFDVGYYERTSNFHIDENNGIRVVVHLSLTP